MTLSLAELRTHRTPAEIEAEVHANMRARGLDPSTWKQTSVAHTIVKGFSIVLSAQTRIRAAIAGGGFLPFAEGTWLTLLARHVYGVERIEGAPAEGTITLTNNGGGVYAGEAGDLVFSCSAGDAIGKTYRSIEAYSLPSGSSSPKSTDVAIEAVETGTDSSALAGEINTLETKLIGVSCTNALALIGVDRETDAELRRRCLEKLGSLSACGPRDAYGYAVRTAVDADGQSLGVNRVRTIADGRGGIRVIVAAASGFLTAPNVAIVQTAIDALATPEGITAIAESAVAVAIAVTYELWVRDEIELTNEEIEAAVGDALEALVSSTPIGGAKITGAPTGRLHKQAIEGAIGRAVGIAYLVDLEVTAPAGDTDLAVDEAPGIGAVVATLVHRVTP